VIGVFLGVILLGVVSNAMNILGVSSFYQTAVLGIIIVGAVTVSNLNKKKRSSI
jgi:ribose/xylose/arabinose/galactoside ABC-type transport system permease subunit